MLDKSFQETLQRTEDWINEKSGWVIESIDAEFVNISVFSPLSGSTYIELPCRLRNSVKGLINVKARTIKCFIWCHIRHLNPIKIHPERISKAYKNMVNDLDREGIEFAVSKNDFNKIKNKINICIKVFCYGNNLFYVVDVSNEKFETCMDLLMTTDENKSHYDYIRTKNTFASIAYSVLVKKEF